ncbi:electron transfer flavoprotein subunit alpha/FixB family protein [Candidatus Bathyarchaeota archaeon]|nr:MAG: electron transfer flavoprotein subunit alpha/FixB family protein [Candidatus Bathyarchaeota archaeon]
MKEIFVLAEHRRGELRDITFELLSLGRKLAEKLDGNLVSAVLGFGVKDFTDKVARYAEQVLVVEDEKLKEFNSEAYQKVLTNILEERKPFLILLGHTSYGMELAPSLSTALNIPLTTDCIGLDFKDGKLQVIRQMYGGKVNAEVSFSEAESYMVTVRSGAFPVEEPKITSGKIIVVPSHLTEEDLAPKRFVEYIEEAKGEVDITSADIIVSVGRGIKDAKNIPLVEGLAKALGGVLASTRPIVDKGWLPKDRQVGLSGKTVKPKLYIAVGVSGSFQHLAGIKGSGILIAINKDPKAPIFRVADYGIVDDLFKVVPVLKEKIIELKQKI